MPSTFSTFLKFAHFKSEGKVDERAHVKYGKPGQFAAKRSRDKCPYRYSQILNTTLESLTNYLIQNTVDCIIKGHVINGHTGTHKYSTQLLKVQLTI